MERQIYLILENIRSALNVGSILRTADGLGVQEVFLCGYTPYPRLEGDPRLPHLASKIDARIKKTALGAESSQKWSHHPEIASVITELKAQEIEIVALEQANGALELTSYQPKSSLALIVGNEVDGISESTLGLCDQKLEIPMKGAKESFNVAIASAMALFYIKNMV